MVNQGLATADYLVLVGFFLTMLGIGLFFARRMKNLNDFFSGGQQIPWWVSSVSLYMTSFSAFAFVSYSALAYRHGLVTLSIWWLGVPCWIISARFFAARWRRAVRTSPLEYIEGRYGRVLRQGFVWEGIPLLLVDDALKLLVIGKMVTVSLGLTDTPSLLIAIAACGLIMLCYTFLGGLWAVMVTDFIQFIVMATAVIVFIPLVLMRAGGFSGIFRNAPADFFSPTGGDYTWPWLIAFSFIMLMNFATRWPLVQRYYAVNNDTDARKVGYLVAFLTFIGPPLLFLPAMAARAFMPDIANANDIYPLLCKELLPVGMLGMMIAAMFSATMSMLSSDYNAAAAVLTNDVYKRLIAPKTSEKKLVWIGRCNTLFFGLFALALALILGASQDKTDLVKIMARLFGVLIPPVAIPMMLGLLTRRVSNAGGLGGFLTGATFGILAYGLSYYGELEYLRSVPYLTWITSLPTLFVLSLGSYFLPDSPQKQKEVAQFLTGLQEREGENAPLPASPKKASDIVLALSIIGVATAAIGAVMLIAVSLSTNLYEARLSILVGALMLFAGMLTLGHSKKLESKKKPKEKEAL